MTGARKTILVTGATGGIGEPTCRYLRSQGYDLILTARTDAALRSLSDALRASGEGLVDYRTLDFSDPGSIKEFGAWINKAHAKLDGLVLMPPQVSPTDNCLPPDEEWTKIFSQSFIGPLALVRECIPRLALSARAKVVVISGISSAQVLGHYATSNVLRTAWLGQAKTLAFALGPQRIHVNTLSLGGTLTKKYVDRLEKKAKDNGRSYDEQMAEETGNVPLRKYATTQEVAQAIEGLLGRVSDHMSGVNLLLDGGFTRAY